jgi:hypothetical protein
MNQNNAKFRTDASPTRYVALAVIPLTVIVATVIGTVAATHIISQAFAEIQASAGAHHAMCCATAARSTSTAASRCPAWSLRPVYRSS